MDNNIEKVIIVTGATGSIGKELATALARTGQPIILAVRNVERGEAIAKEIAVSSGNSNIIVNRLDLEDVESIKSFSSWLDEKGASVHALVNNAGVMNRYYRRAKSGIEATMAVNLIGTALLVRLVAERIVPGGRIVFTTSLTRRFHSADTIDIDEKPEKFSQLGTYGRSKAALTHYALYLCQRYPHLYVNCADPGVVNTDMITMKRWYDGIASVMFRPLIRTPRQGAKAALRALTLTSSGNVATVGGVEPIGYNPYDSNHARLVEEIRSKVEEFIQP